MDVGYTTETNIYEQGIAIEGDDRPLSLRLIATAKPPIFADYTLSILDLDANSLNKRAFGLAKINGPHFVADYYEEKDLMYSILAMLYHLNRIIDVYVSITQRLQLTSPPGSCLRANTADRKVFFEIDAFLGAARRVYVFIERVILKHYFPTKRHRGSSIKNVTNMLRKDLPLFATEMKESWEVFGKKLQDYRDCVAHNDPLNDGGSTCRMEWFGNRWGMIIKLPANPEQEKRDAFDFKTGPEALSYCHSVACHLVELCESLEAQTKVASYLANPRMG